MEKRLKRSSINWFLIFGLISACNAPLVRHPAEVIAKAHACCASVSELPPAVQFGAEEVFNLDAETPHFDFGFGLAPFKSFRLPTDARLLEYRALVNSGGANGIGPLIPDVRLVFLDVNNRAIPTPSYDLYYIGEFGWRGIQKLRAVVKIPEMASTIVFTSFPGSAGKMSHTSVNAIGTTMKIGAAFVNFPSGTRQMEFMQSPYGEITARTSSSATLTHD